MNPQLQLQNQVRHNASDIKNYLKELYDWEEEVNGKERPAAEKEESDVPIRGKVEIDLHQQKSIKELQRDANTIKDYYSAWNKFDVDKELDRVDEVAPKSQPSARIVIKGGSTQKSEAKPQVSDPILSLKEDANLKFKLGNYAEAISLYQLSQDQLDQQPSLNKDEQELLVVLHSNKAQCLIYLQEYLEAIKECNQALQVNQYHLKSLSRKATCLKKLGKWKDAVKEYRVAVTIDKTLEKELQALEQKLLKQKNAAKEKLLKLNVDYKKLKDMNVVPVVDVKEGKKEDEEGSREEPRKSEPNEARAKQKVEEVPERERKIRFGEVQYEKQGAEGKPKLTKRSSLKQVLKYKGDKEEKVSYKASYDYKTLNEKNIDGKVLKKEE